MIVQDIILPPAIDGETTSSGDKLAPFVTLKFEPVGRWFESYCSRRHHKQTLSHDSQLSSSSEDEDVDDGIDDEDSSIVITLDPKNWKNQDHYAVLGLSKLRYKATDEQIKRAYKRKVLQHHPDKRRAAGIPVKQGEEDYFTCITRAYEILGVPQKRRAYDSVDPLFDDTVPAVNAESKLKFYEVFGPVFEQNSRWSVKRKKVPQLGNENTPFAEINKFYSFWYDFESWREYSYLDEDDKDKGENRDERRWIDKQNKAARQKLKKEETLRIRQLVDNAYLCDPRIARFKSDEKEKKLAEKKAKQDAIRQKAEEEERKRQEILDAERLLREKEEEQAKAQAAAQKKEKDSQKRILKKERKTLRNIMKDLEYLSLNDSERIQNMQDLDKLAELSSAACLESLNAVLTSGDKEKSREAFYSCVKEMNDRLELEKKQMLEMSQKSSSSQNASDKTKAKDNWSELEIQTLIKAVNLFPAGTTVRWETIANFIKLHVPDSNRNAKETLAKAKELQKNDTGLKEEANKKAFEKFAQDSKGASVAVAEVSERYETAAETQVYDVGSNPAPWSPDEQKLLEQAMRTFPASVPDRWDKIAEAIPLRSKKDCMKRYKELVELIRTKKLAQAASATKKK